VHDCSSKEVTGMPYLSCTRSRGIRYGVPVISRFSCTKYGKHNDVSAQSGENSSLCPYWSILYPLKLYTNAIRKGVID